MSVVVSEAAALVVSRVEVSLTDIVSTVGAVILVTIFVVAAVLLGVGVLIAVVEGVLASV